MTQEGLDKLKKDLAEALAQRPVISAAIAEAREKGDLSENAEYDAAREAQGLLEVKIAKLKDLVANAKIIDESQVNTDKVQMLNKVKVENLSMKQVMELRSWARPRLISPMANLLRPPLLPKRCWVIRSARS